MRNNKRYVKLTDANDVYDNDLKKKQQKYFDREELLWKSQLHFQQLEEKALWK